MKTNNVFIEGNKWVSVGAGVFALHLAGKLNQSVFLIYF